MKKEFLMGVGALFFVACSNNGVSNEPQQEAEQVVEEDVVEPTSPEDKVTVYAYSAGDVNLEITLTEQFDMSYEINYCGEKFEGICSITEEDGARYIHFEGDVAGSTDVEMVIDQDGNATIQNYGSADNQFCRFKKIEEKYIELTKK